MSPWLRWVYTVAGKRLGMSLASGPARRRVACFDLDGVILEYDGWKGPEHFGDPMPGVIKALQWFRNRGWYLVIFTTRNADRESEAGRALLRHLDRSGLLRYLDAINNCDHNPPDTAKVKPIADIYFDDRDWQSLGRPWDWRRVMKRVRKLYPESTEHRAFMGED